MSKTLVQEYFDEAFERAIPELSDEELFFSRSGFSAGFACGLRCAQESIDLLFERASQEELERMEEK